MQIKILVKNGVSTIIIIVVTIVINIILLFNHFANYKKREGKRKFISLFYAISFTVFCKVNWGCRKDSMRTMKSRVESSSILSRSAEEDSGIFHYPL